VSSVCVEHIDQIFDFFLIAMFANGYPGVVMLPEHLEFLGSLHKYGLDFHFKILFGGQEHIAIISEFIIEVDFIL
jgi:hypothetical protein